MRSVVLCEGAQRASGCCKLDFRNILPCLTTNVPQYTVERHNFKAPHLVFCRFPPDYDLAAGVRADEVIARSFAMSQESDTGDLTSMASQSLKDTAMRRILEG